MASIRRSLEEVESCKGELHLPQGAEESLLIFSRAQQLLQTVQELEQLTEQQSMQLQVHVPSRENSHDRCTKYESDLICRCENGIFRCIYIFWKRNLELFGRPIQKCRL